MIILSIETSCDDTCVAILEVRNSKFKILSNLVSSQVKLHRKYGGVYPFLAKREHQRNLPIVLNRALRKAGFVNPKSQIPNPTQSQNSKFQISKLDLIGVTVGPGLEPCLWVGVNFAKELAERMKLPIVPVNHVEAHIFANWLTPIGSNFQTIFPAVCLVVSGGHTQLILMNPHTKRAHLKNCAERSARYGVGVKNYGDYKILGETRDDAAGECFDKVARILGLGYPGGPAIAEQARRWKFEIRNSKFEINLPRPMIYQKNYDFSFSGLKTAVLYQNQKSKTELPQEARGKKRTKSSSPIKSQKYKQAMSAETQQAIIDVLITKTIRAVKEYKAKTVILGGGVAANDELRKQFNYKLKTINYKLKHLVPPKNLCTDNAAMIAVAAYFNQKRATKDWKKIRVNANLKIDENY